MSGVRRARKRDKVRRSDRITEMANADADDRVDPSSVFDYISPEEETLTGAIGNGGDRSSSDGKSGNGGVCSVGCSSSADYSSDDGTRRRRDINDGWDQLSSDEDQGGDADQSAEGVVTGGKGRPDLAESVKGLAIEGNGRFDLEERVQAAVTVASEAEGHNEAAIKNKGKKATIEEEDQNEPLASLPEEPQVATRLVSAPLDPNSARAQEYCCTLCGVFYRSTDGYPRYKPFTTARSSRRPPKLSVHFLPEPVDVLASSYGLLCCRPPRTSGRYYACNPTTENWMTLPFPPDITNHGNDTAVAIVFDKPMTAACFESEYHVVCAYPVQGLEGGVYAFDVFSSKTWRWTTSKELCFAEKLIPTSGVGVAGKACWMTTMNTAVVFDPAKDELQTVPWPVGYSGDDVTWSLAELQGELCAVCVRSSGADAGTDVYNLENGSDGGGTLGWRKTWEKVSQVPDSACPLPGQSTTELLFKNGNELLAVDVKTGACRTIGDDEEPIIGDAFTIVGDEEPIIGDAFLPYTSSLVQAYGIS